MSCVNLCRHVLVHLPLFSQADNILPVGIADRGIIQARTHVQTSLISSPPPTLRMRLCGVCHYLSRQTQNSTGNITAFIYSFYCAKIKQNRETSLHVCNEFNYYCSFLSESEVPDP